ncbi:hypothetical protein [Roseiarcus sp.]|uniref:hypothetical protein n=1 Tax=Roseiarcus sp. TaxID=1969460 RepID=UPI003F9E2BA8
MCESVAWLVLTNKPLYPLTIWAFIGPEAAVRSLAVLAVAPLYAAILWLARRFPYGARVALPLVGLADTILAAKVFGPGSGAELFLVACGALAVVGFSGREATTARVLVMVVYASFILALGRLGAPLEAWPPDELARLFVVNAYSAASLAAFVGLRFAAAR